MIEINEQDFTKEELEYYKKKLVGAGFTPSAREEFQKPEKEVFRYKNGDITFSHKFHLSTGNIRDSYYVFYINLPDSILNNVPQAKKSIAEPLLTLFESHIFKGGSGQLTNIGVSIAYWRLDKDTEKQVDDILKKIEKVPSFIKRLKSLMPKQKGRF